MTNVPSTDAKDKWTSANKKYLDDELQLLRLLLQKRVLWLRKLWGRDDESADYPGLVISERDADRLLAGADRSAETQFYQRDARATAISRAVEETKQRIESQRQTFMRDGEPAPIDALAQMFMLTPFDRNVLLLCLATELDSSFEQLFAYVQNDVTRKYATPQLALSLFGGEGDEWLAARGRLMTDAPLRHFRLLTLEEARASGASPSTRPLRLSERVVDYLLGAGRLDAHASQMLKPVPAAPCAGEQEELVERLQQRLMSVAGDTAWPAVNLIGAKGAGKSAVARALCERLNLKLYELNFSQLPPSGAERFEALRLIEREALLAQFAVYFDTSNVEVGPEAQTVAPADDFLERLGVFIIVGSRERWQTRRKTVSVHLSKPDTDAQRVLWRQVLGGVRHSTNGAIEEIVQQFDFGPLDISQTVAAAQSHASLRGPEESELTADDLWRACREQAGWRLDELAQRIEPVHTWDDIVLPEDVYRQLQEIAAQVAFRAKVYDEWGFGAKLNRGRGINALFAGPSGTGKTLAAEILADHLNLFLYRIDLSGVVSKYIGETEKNLRRVFDAAEQSGAILFFDEADALFGKRSEVKDSHDRYANIEINYLLQRMEEYRGLAILATNMKSYMDEAFMRRLRFLVDFPFPDAEYRAMIWRKVIPREAEADELDYDALSRLEIAGGNIKNIALNAAFLAASEEQTVGMKHIFHAARREYAKIDKLVLEYEFGKFYPLVRR